MGVDSYTISSCAKICGTHQHILQIFKFFLAANRFFLLLEGALANFLVILEGVCHEKVDCNVVVGWTIYAGHS